MDNEILIDGLIYHGPGGCPKCGGPLVVVDSELTFMELNTDGIPISEETSIRCNAACLHCKERQEMVRWQGGYIPFSRTSLLLKELQFKDEIKDRMEKIKEKNNPFY